MESIAATPTWDLLAKHKLELSKVHMKDLFTHDDQRFEHFSAEHDGFLLDYSKNRISQETVSLLLQLVDQAQLEHFVDDMFCGEKINATEHRAVLHAALRDSSNSSLIIDHNNVIDEIKHVLAHMEQASEKLRKEQWLGFSGKPINTIVNLGIGGSDLGPHMVVHALENYADEKLTAHFVSNVDGTAITRVLKKCNPETTLFIVSSKSFTTTETLANAKAARAWLLQHTTEDKLSPHLVAVTSKVDAALAWGFSEENIFKIWDWVGGRYSVWSAIGLPISMMCGMDVFKDFLKGAHDMDKHFMNSDYKENLPVLLALTGVWNHNFFHMPSNAILPYCEALKFFPDYLQQLEMESNGKSVDIYSREITDFQTSPVLWGAVGTNGQHSFHQLLHQGTARVWCDFILPISAVNEVADQHKLLAANCFAQSQALMQGKTQQQAMQELIDSGMDHDHASILAPHKMIPGNRPSNTLLMDELTPHRLGSLIALYEHKVFTQSVIWQINAFDQWGVELGKKLATNLMPSLNGQEGGGQDCSTQGLVKAFNK